MKKYLIGIDIGTSGLKAGVIDETGMVLARTSIKNSSSFEGTGRARQDALSIVINTAKLIETVCNLAGILPTDVAALGLDGQMGGIIGINDDFDPITGLDMGLDLTSEQINADFHQKYHKELLSISCGSPRNTPKIVWWKKHEPEIYKKVRRFTTLSGYVAGVLAGLRGEDAAIDDTMIAYFGNEDAKQRNWSKELTELWDIDIKKMPRIGKPWDILGTISKSVSRQTGLTEGTPIVFGAGDQPAGFFGGGFEDSGTLIDIGGSTTMLTLCVDEFKPDIEKGSIMYLPAVDRHKYFATWYINGGGMVMPWFHNNFGGNFSLAELSTEADKIPVGSNNLLFSPYFNGRQCPYHNNLRGSWVGLNLSHKPADMMRSIYEGISAQYSQGLSSINRLFPNLLPSIIEGIGGAAKDNVLTRIKANFTQREYRIHLGFDASLRGSAIIAGLGVGIFDINNIPSPEKTVCDYTIKTDPEKVDSYKKLRSTYSQFEKKSLEEICNGLLRLSNKN